MVEQSGEMAVMGPRAGFLAGLRERLMRSRRGLLAVIVVLIAAMSCFAAFKKGVWKAPSVDRGAVAVAAHLVSSFRGGDGAVSPGQPRSHAGPGYPLVLFALAFVDERVAKALACEVKPQSCAGEDRGAFTSVVVVQTIAAIAGLLFAFAAALRVSGSWEVAVLTLILVFVASRVGDFAGLVRPFVWAPALTYLALWLAAEACVRRNVLLAAGSGVAVGAGALFMPLILVMVPAMAVVFLLGRGMRWSGVLCALAVVAGGAGSIFGGLSLAEAYGYDGGGVMRQLTIQLAERVAFQAMGLEDWLTSLLIPIPMMSGLAELLFSQESIRLFVGMHAEGTYAWQGVMEVFPRAVKATDTPVGQFLWLAQDRIGQNPGAFAAATVSVFLRGLWANAGLIGLVGLFHVWWMVRVHRAEHRFGPLLIVLVPVVALLAANTMLSANHPFYNPGLVLAYSYAIASVAGLFGTGAGR